MKAIVCTKYGPPEVLKLVNVERPRPKKNEVCIRVVATSVTASDCIIRKLEPTSLTRIMARLVLGVTAPRRPILGLVLAGEIESVGPDAKTVGEGDEVFGMNGSVFGAYAEMVCWPEDGILALKPANLTFAETAAIPYGGLLAMHFLRKAGIETRRRVLVYGASGAIGTAAVQLVRHFGGEVTAVCSGANSELVKSLGASVAIDYTKEDFTKLRERYDLIFDAVGKRKSRQTMINSRTALAPDGIVVSVDDGLARPLRSDLVLLKELCESGELQPVIDRTYSLEQIVEAHRYVDEGHKRGNVIVSP